MPRPKPSDYDYREVIDMTEQIKTQKDDVPRFELRKRTRDCSSKGFVGDGHNDLQYFVVDNFTPEVIYTSIWECRDVRDTHGARERAEGVISGLLIGEDYDY